MNVIHYRRVSVFAALLGAAAVQTLIGCGSDSTGQSGKDGGGSGGSASGSGGGNGSGSGGSNGGGSGGATTGSGGSGAGNDAGASTGSGGSNNGSGGAGVKDAGGSGGTVGTDAGGGNKKYTCTLVIGISVTYDWFTSGFEMGAGIDNARWELLGTATPLMSFIQNWSDPASPLWTMAKISPCTMNADNVDRVVAVGFDNPKLTTAAQWLAAYDKLIATLKGKFSNVKTIVLDTITRAPGNKACGAGAAAAEAVVQPYTDAAIDMAVAKYAGLVKAGPRLAVPSCSTFTGVGPHFTEPGKKVVAKEYSDYWVNDQ